MVELKGVRADADLAHDALFAAAIGRAKSDTTEHVQAAGSASASASGSAPR